MTAVNSPPFLVNCCNQIAYNYLKNSGNNSVAVDVPCYLPKIDGES